MENKFVVTIGRQFGSGGRKVAFRLSQLMNVNYYDKALILEAAKRSGLSNEFLENSDEKTPGRLYYAFTLGFGINAGFSSENVFNIQAETIRDIAQQQSCVIVGRSADYILREHPQCFNIFIHAPEAERIKFVAARENISPKEAAELIQKIDKSRAAYYDFYTNKKWGDSSSYHLSIDSSILGMEKTAELIQNFINKALCKQAD